MKSVSLQIAARIALLAMLAAGGSFAIAQNAQTKKAAKPGSAPASSASAAKPAGASAERPTESLQKTATQAQARIKSSASERKALFGAMQSKNTEQAKSILLRNGFTAKQLEGASIVFNDTTGGHGNPTTSDIEIDVYCCPLRITIKISL